MLIFHVLYALPCVCLTWYHSASQALAFSDSASPNFSFSLDIFSASWVLSIHFFLCLWLFVVLYLVFSHSSSYMQLKFPKTISRQAYLRSSLILLSFSLLPAPSSLTLPSHATLSNSHPRRSQRLPANFVLQGPIHRRSTIWRSHAKLKVLKVLMEALMHCWLCGI